MSDDFHPQQPPQTFNVITTSQSKSPKSVTTASWGLLTLCCLGSLLPGIGFGVWIIVFPVLLATFILGIVATTRGAVAQGILILIATLIVVPIFVFVAPIVTTGAVLEAAEMEEFQN